LSLDTYRESKGFGRFVPEPDAPSRIILIAEDVNESAYQLSPVSSSAINGNWEKTLAPIVQEMATRETLSPVLGKELLLADPRFTSQGYTGRKRVDDDTIPALVLQYIESHDEDRLFHLM